MKILVSNKFRSHHHLVIERKFFFWKYTEVYRKINYVVYRYKGKNTYERLGDFSSIEISSYFDILLEE